MLKCDDRSGRSPSTSYDLIKYIDKEFGSVSVRKVHKGKNSNWFLDQRLVSILVAGWKRQHGADRVKLMPRACKTDRLITLFVTQAMGR